MKRIGLVVMAIALMFAVSGIGASAGYLDKCKANCSKPGTKAACVKKCECRAKCYTSKGVLEKKCKELKGKAQTDCSAAKKACKTQCK